MVGRKLTPSTKRKLRESAAEHIRKAAEIVDKLYMTDPYSGIGIVQFPLDRARREIHLWNAHQDLRETELVGVAKHGD